jgi:hypothetical protein
MSIEAVTNRRSNTGYREYYEYIEYLGDLCLATEALNKRIDGIRKYIGNSYTSKAEVDVRLEPAVDDAQNVLRKTNPFNKKIRMNDYFRLMAHTNLASEMALAPSVFAGHNMEARTELTDGITGTITQIVENALDIYNDDNPVAIRSQASGVIAEFSAIALANLAEDGTSIMLPSSQYADFVDKIDADYYGTPNGHEAEKRRRTGGKRQRLFRTAVQIKGTRRPAIGSTVARELEKNYNAVHIFGSDFNNLSTSKRQFPVSRLLVSEMNGIEEIEYQREILNEQSQNIKDRIHRQKNNLNSREL